MEVAEENPEEERILTQRVTASEAVLTEAVRQADVVHTSLAGMTAIVVVLLVAVALPVFGYSPVTNIGAFIIMVITALVGIGGMYFINYRVHQHVTNQARLTEVLVNSLGQGFLVFGKKGICENVYSQACLDLLETTPSGKNIADVLKIPEDKREEFQDWLDILFQADHALSFEDVCKFLPQFFPHSQGRRISLVYRPIRDRVGNLTRVVVIATDQTEEYMARQAAKRQQMYAEMICRIFKERNKYHKTISNVRDFLETISSNQELRNSANILRQLHTLKAMANYFNLVELGDALHEAEGDLRDPLIDNDEKFKKTLYEARQKIADALLKTTDEIRNLVGSEQEWRGNIREIEEKELYAFAEEMVKQNASPSLINKYMAKIAAVPIRDCFHSFERELKELATVLDKQIKPIKFTGENPRILTQPIQDFLYSLTHISRNIMDHGIEAAVTRMARGKDPAGQVTIETNLVPREDGKGEWLYITISDDGNGIDPSRIRAKLSAIDPEGDWRFEDDHTVIQRIFSWGVSTREEADKMSGRGVGLEAVEREVKLLGGSISVSSELYKGATFNIRIPYILDIKQIMSFSGGKDAA